jgi:hypothetical protein
MRRATLMLAAIGALTLVPALAARADVAGCRAELQQLAQTYHLSLGPSAPGAPQSSPDTSAEAPATTESRGLAGGPDSLGSSGGSLPPSTGTPPEQRRGAAPAQQLGAADRAKVEGLLSQGQAADVQGKGDQCLAALRQARSVLEKSRQ